MHISSNIFACIGLYSGSWTFMIVLWHVRFSSIADIVILFFYSLSPNMHCMLRQCHQCDRRCVLNIVVLLSNEYYGRNLFQDMNLSCREDGV